MPLTWGDFTPELFDLPKIDIILGSDCFYSPTGNKFPAEFILSLDLLATFLCKKLVYKRLVKY